MEVKQDELQMKTEKALKCMIYMTILAFFELIVAIICSIVFDTFYISIVSTIFISVFIFLEIKYCIRSAKNNEVDQMIFGNEFQYINLNNERLLSMINDFNISIGRIELAIETIYFADILFLLSLAFHIFHVLIFLL